MFLGEENVKINFNSIAKVLVLSTAAVLILLAPSTGLAQTDYVSFKSVSGSYIAHSNGLCNLEQITAKSDKLLKKDASFKVVPALDGSDGWSFESVTLPGNYLRHENGRLKLGKFVNDEGFKKDASFRTSAALTGAGDAVSIESVNFPGYYVRSDNGELVLEKSDGSAEFKTDATFKMVAALSR